jgi:regulator of sirC expression with transglutaminase-like and TPR domain
VTNPIHPPTTQPGWPWWQLAFRNAADSDSVDLLRAAHALSAHGSALAVTEDSWRSLSEAIAALADGVRTVDQWRTRLFVDAGFTGNGADYHDVRNSFLPDVLERRLGIPITLALVGRLVAEHAGLVSWGIGLPGHFLLAVAPAGSTRGMWMADGVRIVDPFNGGRTLSLDDVQDLLQSMFGGRYEFHPSMLNLTSDHATLIRMLANLKSNYARLRSLDGLTAVARLRVCLPDWSLDEGRELVRLLTANNQLDEASGILAALSEEFPADEEILDAERARLARSLN